MNIGTYKSIIIITIIIDLIRYGGRIQLMLRCGQKVSKSVDPSGLVRGIRYSRHRHTHSPPAVDVWHRRFGTWLDPVVSHRQISIRACRGEQIWQGRLRIRCSPGFSAWPYPLHSLRCTSRKCYYIIWCLSSTIRRWHSTVYRAEKRRFHF